MASIAVNGSDATSRPSTWKKLPFWMMNPQAPVTADPLPCDEDGPLVPALLAAGRPRRIREIEDAGASLATRSLGDIRRLLADLNAPELISEATCLQLYKPRRRFRTDATICDLWSATASNMKC